MTPQERAILTRTASGLSLQLKCGVYYNADRPDEFRAVKDVEGDQEQARRVAEELRLELARLGWATLSGRGEPRGNGNRIILIVRRAT